MYVRRQRLTHQLNHITPGPSRPTSYPPAPPRSHRDDCLSHQLNHTTQLPPRLSTTTATSQPTQPPAQHDDHQRLRRLATSRRRLESATAASNSQIANGNCKSSIFFFFFWFCFCFYIDYLYKQYTNRLSHDKLTTTSSRNINGDRTPATAGTTVTRIPAAEAAAEVVAAAAAATNHRCVFFFF